ncbi:unnamed protein product [Anisakis simplex]|uniref:LMWPc domain-containing protein n=1 Tax=Anisakis simplex TaxID=6269 RepID=A0A0M3JSC6_ANISI|nr:unnamed protein product [Anisakis simplex]
MSDATSSFNDTTSMHKSILFVCLGNICRSPMAEAIFANMIKNRGLLDKWRVESAAVIDYHVGRQPDKRTLETLQKFGINDYKHKARQVAYSYNGYVVLHTNILDENLIQEYLFSNIVTTEDFRNFDFIMGMDEHNIVDLKEIEKLAGNGKASVEMFGIYDPNGANEIPDPYYEKGVGAFEKVNLMCFHFVVIKYSTLYEELPDINYLKLLMKYLNNCHGAAQHFWTKLTNWILLLIKKMPAMDVRVMYLILRSDLISLFKWPLGAVVTQGAHAATACIWAFKDDSDVVEYMKDTDHMRKITLQVKDESELKSIATVLQENDIDHRIWIEDDMPVCIAVKPLPKNIVQKHLKHLQLFS